MNENIHYPSDSLNISETCFFILQKTRKGIFHQGYYKFYDFIDRKPLNNPNEYITALCIGYDHKISLKEVKEKNIPNRMDSETAYYHLINDIKRCEVSILKNINWKLKQNYFDALVMLVFDIGDKTFLGSMFFKALKDCSSIFNNEDRNFTDLADYFIQYKSYKSKYSKRIFFRRCIEKEIWLNGYSEELINKVSNINESDFSLLNL